MKTILVTGSTAGIGKLAATRLANEGHTVYIHGRNAEKVSNLVSELKASSKNEHIRGFVADLSNLSTVKELGIEINNTVEKLDVLINNAGIFKSLINQTDEGFDIRFAVNYFAPFLLTETLLPLLKKENRPRIINLSSAAQASISYEALAGTTTLSMNSAYAQSKLALTMWSFHLADKEPNIGVIAVNPGSLLNTKMVMEAYGQYWAPAEKGSNILYDLAIEEEYQNVSGKYFDNDKGELKGIFSKAHSDAYDEDMIEELIEKTQLILSTWT